MQVCSRFCSACMYSHLLIVCVWRLLCVQECVDRKRGLLSTIRTPHAPFKMMIICFVLLSVNYHYSFDSLSAAEPSVWSKVFLELSAFKLFVCGHRPWIHSHVFIHSKMAWPLLTGPLIQHRETNKSKIACGKQPRWDFTHWSSFLTDFLILLFPHWSLSAAPANVFKKVNVFQSLYIKMLYLILVTNLI